MADAESSGEGVPCLIAMNPDGSDGAVYPVSSERVDLGSEQGDIVLEGDPYLSSRHARLEFSEGSWTLRDLDSVNGIYVEILGKRYLNDRDFLLLGQQVILFEILKEHERDLGPVSQNGVLLFGTPDEKPRARISVVSTEGIVRSVYHLCGSEVVIGRDHGDVVMPRDLFMSGTHATFRYERERGSYSIQDAGSSNGTLVRIGEPEGLSQGQRFRIGRHLFRFDVSRRGSQA